MGRSVFQENQYLQEITGINKQRIKNCPRDTKEVVVNEDLQNHYCEIPERHTPYTAQTVGNFRTDCTKIHNVAAVSEPL